MRHVRHLVVAFAASLVASMGCSSGSSGINDTGRGGTAGATATGRGGSSTSGGAGTTVGGTGGSTASGGTTGSAGTGLAGTGGTAGSAAGTGGATSGTAGSSGGAGAAAGAGGNAGASAGHAGGAGAAGGAAAGAGAGGSGAESPAAALDMFRFECPCKTGAGDHTSNDNCNVTPQTDRQTITKKMGGDPGTAYNVTFRVRGLTEPNTYTGGTLHDPDKRFYTGGTTSTSGYTSYMMTVGDPAAHYFFNYNATTSHMHFLLDYMVTVKIRGGTTVTFDVDGDGSVPDGHQVANFDMLVVPGVPPAPNWYDGQFVQLDVVSAVPAP